MSPIDFVDLGSPAGWKGLPQISQMTQILSQRLLGSRLSEEESLPQISQMTQILSQRLLGSRLSEEESLPQISQMTQI